MSQADQLAVPAGNVFCNCSGVSWRNSCCRRKDSLRLDRSISIVSFFQSSFSQLLHSSRTVRWLGAIGGTNGGRRVDNLQDVFPALCPFL